jgi:hypothetical protein
LTAPNAVGDTRGKAADGNDWRALMGRLWGDLERTALREAGKLIGGNWEKAIDLVAEPVPPTPEGMVSAPDDEAAGRLDPIEHIVVVMLENRSFDHMLGYLSLPAELGGKDRGDVDGLRGIEQDFNMLGSDRYRSAGWRLRSSRTRPKTRITLAPRSTNSSPMAVAGSSRTSRRSPWNGPQNWTRQRPILGW